MGMVALEKVETPEDMEALRGFIEEHKKHTGSTVAQALLDDFGTTVTQFVKVIYVKGVKTEAFKSNYFLICIKPRAAVC